MKKSGLWLPAPFCREMQIFVQVSPASFVGWLGPVSCCPVSINNPTIFRLHRNSGGNTSGPISSRKCVLMRSWPPSCSPPSPWSRNHRTPNTKQSFYQHLSKFSVLSSIVDFVTGVLSCHTVPLRYLAQKFKLWKSRQDSTTATNRRQTPESTTVTSSFFRLRRFPGLFL